MVQIKIYSDEENLAGRRGLISDTIHACVVDVLAYPPDKRAHRFFALSAEDFYRPPGRSERYTILEISMFEGRTVDTTKRLLLTLIERLGADCGIDPVDVEITVTETPRHAWGIRGRPADELELNYRVEL